MSALLVHSLQCQACHVFQCKRDYYVCCDLRASNLWTPLRTVACGSYCCRIRSTNVVHVEVMSAMNSLYHLNRGLTFILL